MAPSAAVLSAGAVAYLVLVGLLGVTFDATPLIVGLIVLAAATIGRAQGLTATALTLVGWGLAVVLTRHGRLPDEREAATFLIGAGLGLLAARVVARMRPGVDSGRARRSSSPAGPRSSSPSMPMALRLARLDRGSRRLAAWQVVRHRRQRIPPRDGRR